MLSVVNDRSQVAEARRAAAAHARGRGFDEIGIARIALAATELATNLVKHGGGGEIVIDNFADRDGVGLELLAIDRGCGINDVARAVEDGYSTTGSPGTGLGAIRRQADVFALWSRPGQGAAVMARFRRGPAGSGIAVGAVVRPIAGEATAGDAWQVKSSPAGPTVALIDGSGHGAPAALAAQAGLQEFDARTEYDCVRLMEAMHRALAATRGGAAAIARIDAGQQIVRYVGIGNIAGAVVVDGVVHRMVSLNGIAGHVASRIREFTYAWCPDATIILHSDGLSARWDINAYPGLAASHPSLVAGVLFRDYRREKDDACVVVLSGAP
jgi:anti-sigma regulatory factor (Ser/Thr protein kinase)